jgi:ubiquinone/menaquinone biosynthesis C-methylase UbiE
MTDESRRFYEQAVNANYGPEVYDAFARTYEDFFFKLNTTMHTSAVQVWRTYHDPKVIVEFNEETHKVFDAGCGTGLAGVELKKYHPKLEVYGGDYSPGMLEESKKKNAYADLRIVNLKEELPYEPDSFDSVISSGVFLQGHCGPECVPNIIRVLKKDHYFVTTIRKKFYNEVQDEWLKAVEKSGATQLEAKEMPYHDEAEGLVLVIKRN